MDAKKKLALFEKYNFSKSAMLRRAGVDEESSKTARYHGFGAMVQAIIIQLGIIKDGECDDVDEFDKVKNEILEHYGWLQARYDDIDWDELDPEDPDLSLFFDMKEKIDRLGALIDTFLEESRKHLCKGVEPPVYTEIQELVEEIRDLTQAFRKAMERLKNSQKGD